MVREAGGILLKRGTGNAERGMWNGEREKTIETKPSNLTLCPISNFSNFISLALFSSHLHFPVSRFS